MGKSSQAFLEQREKELKIKQYPLTMEDCWSKDCPICDGAGAFGYSSCCGSSIIDGLCALCNQPTQPERCDTCNGTGQVPMDEDDIRDYRENQELLNHEMMKDL